MTSSLHFLGHLENRCHPHSWVIDRIVSRDLDHQDSKNLTRVKGKLFDEIRQKTSLK